jgi:hypothetical protein
MGGPKVQDIATLLASEAFVSLSVESDHEVAIRRF